MSGSWVPAVCRSAGCKCGCGIHAGKNYLKRSDCADCCFSDYCPAELLICLHVVPILTEPAHVRVVDHHPDQQMNLELRGVRGEQRLRRMRLHRQNLMTLVRAWIRMQEVRWPLQSLVRPEPVGLLWSVRSVWSLWLRFGRQTPVNLRLLRARTLMFVVRGGCVRSVVCAARLGVSRRVTRRLSRWKLLGRSRRIGHRIDLSGSWRTLSHRLACDISAVTSWILLTMMVVSREVTVAVSREVTVGVSREATVVATAGIAVVTEVIVVVVAVDGRTVMVIRGGVDSRGVVMSQRVTRTAHRRARLVVSRG